MVRPVFVPKNRRVLDDERAKRAAEEEREKALAKEARKALKKSTREQITEAVRQSAVKAENQVNELKRSLHNARNNMVDDTDGVDEEAEYQAWEFREMKRLKRAQDQAQARELEAQETERRRNLTDEERAAEDAELVKQGLRKAPVSTEVGVLDPSARHVKQSKGMFYMDDDTLEGRDDIRLRDTSEATRDDRLRAMQKAIKRSRDADRAQPTKRRRHGVDTSRSSMWGGGRDVDKKVESSN
mmetsp:Transcript_5505/g.8970  ORF Transcript_5505/g.8970 Transcript_5505/m.8970 type:complete len:242 (+) Transcript_5505:778-1503(+)